MSILIRTGSGKTDLSYTENAVKNLKVLQKTGTKSVQWITTQAGTTYNNILQKRGVKDLFYGDISIPSDIPAWYGDPYSGSPVTSKFSITGTIVLNFVNYFSMDSSIKIGEGNLGNGNDSGNYKGNNGKIKSPLSNNLVNGWYGGAPFVIQLSRTNEWATITPDISEFPDFKKFFVVDVNNPNRKLVALLTRNLNYHGTTIPNVTNESGIRISYAKYGFDIRDVYSTIDNFMDGNTYRAGLRLSDS